MSNHSNFLKLLGFCLEFPFPVLVFEDADNGVLNQRGCHTVNEYCKCSELSSHAFPKIIIHRDVKPMHVFLGKNWTAKLSDLSFSITLPEGKLRIGADLVIRTYGYLDPLYYATSYVTEYTDVYSFGICLLVLLTGISVVIRESDEDPVGILSFVRDLCENGKLNEVIDPIPMKDITTGQRLVVERCLSLALKCCEERDEDRPKMIQVAKELKRFETSLRDSS